MNNLKEKKRLTAKVPLKHAVISRISFGINKVLFYSILIPNKIEYIKFNISKINIKQIQNVINSTMTNLESKYTYIYNIT